MKTIIISLILSILFPQNITDTLFRMPNNLNIPGLIPSNSINNKFVLLPYQIDEIKNKAKNYVPKLVSKDDVVVMETNRGTMKLRLFPDIAPRHCANFKKLANSGFYDQTKFHRIVKNFIIQGGDINSRDNDPENDGYGSPGWTIDAEFNDISHKRGILSMSHSGDPNSAGSQFFICVADAPHLDGKFTAFGEVINKVHVIDHIVNTPTNYLFVKKRGKKNIPEGESADKYISIIDPKSKQTLYIKVPKYKDKSEFEYEMKKKINNDRPSLPLIIEKIRVLDKSEYDNENR